MKLFCNHFGDKLHLALRRGGGGSDAFRTQRKSNCPIRTVTGTENAPQSATPWRTKPGTRLLLPRNEAAYAVRGVL